MEPLVNYAYETDDERVKRHMHRELHTWISHLDAITHDGDRLSKIVFSKLRDKELRDEILDNINDNINLLNEFYTYRNVLNNVRECDELECDQIYVHHHDQVFEKYVEAVTQYRDIKDKVFQRLLL